MPGDGRRKARQDAQQPGGGWNLEVEVANRVDRHGKGGQEDAGQNPFVCGTDWTGYGVDPCPAPPTEEEHPRCCAESRQE